MYTSAAPGLPGCRWQRCLRYLAPRGDRRACAGHTAEPLAVLAPIPVTELRGVGPRLAQQLADYGIRQVEDLLFHLPLRYQDRTRITPLAALQEGAEVTVEGEVRLADIVYGRRRSLVARIQDDTGSRTLLSVPPRRTSCNRAPGCAASARCAVAAPGWRYFIRSIAP